MSHRPGQPRKLRFRTQDLDFQSSAGKCPVNQSEIYVQKPVYARKVTEQLSNTTEFLGMERQ